MKLAEMSTIATLVTVVISVGSILFSIAACYYGLKRDNARLGAELEVKTSAIAGELRLKTEQIASDLRLALSTENNARSADQAALRREFVGLMNTMDSFVKELAHRVSTLEVGKDEWTKSLRERTHKMADEIQALVLKVDRLERPASYGPPHS